VKGSCRGPIRILSQNSSGDTDENHGKSLAMIASVPAEIRTESSGRQDGFKQSGVYILRSVWERHW
jgi:hypothetical protein